MNTSRLEGRGPGRARRFRRFSSARGCPGRRLAARSLLLCLGLTWGGAALAEWPDSFSTASVDLSQGYDVGDPVSANCGAFHFSMPLMRLGGPMPLGYVLDYRTNGLNDVYLTGLDGPFGSNHNAWVERLTPPDRSGPILRFFLGGGEMPAFTEDPEHPGAWVLDAASPVRYALQETGGTYDTGYFYLLDPDGGSLYIFEKKPIPGWCSHADNCTSRLAAVMDRNGNTHTYTYAGAAPFQPTRVDDGLGRSLEWTYGGSSPSRLLRVTDQAGRSLTFTPESDAPDCPTWNGRLQPVLRSVADAAGSFTTFRYACAEGSLQLVGAVERPGGNVPYAQTYGKQPLGGEPSLFRAAAQSDAYGNATGLAYDPAVNRVTATRPDGEEVEYRHHHNNGGPKQTTDASGRVATYGQSPSEQIDAITDRMGDATALAYHPETGKIASLTNAKGQTTGWTYAAREQAFANPFTREAVTFTLYGLARVDFPDGTFEAFARDARGNVLARTDRAGQDFTYTYNARGQVLTETNPAGGVTTYTYNEDATPATAADSDTGVTTYAYDAYRRLACVTYPGGACVQLAYDPGDRPTSLIDESGRRTRFAYDANGNLVRVTDPEGRETAYAYDLMDRLVRATDRLGKESARSYDGMNRLSRIQDATGVRVDLGYDPRGWLGTETRAGDTWTTAHDDEGVPASATTPLGLTSTLTTDKLGFLLSATDPEGHTTALEYDALNRVTRVTDPLRQATVYAYDGGGRLSGVTLPGGESATYGYGPLGLPSVITDPGGGRWSFVHTSMGRLQSVADPLGRATVYGYDARGRLSSVTFPGGGTVALTRDDAGNVLRRQFSGGPDLQYGFDAQDRLVTAGGVTLARDAEGRITAAAGGGRVFGATYDDAGRLATATYDSGAFAVSYTYSVGESGSGLLTGMGDSLTGTQVAFAYDDDGRLRTTALPNGETITRTWDNAGRLVRLQSGNHVDLALTYDAAGRVTGADLAAPATPGEHLSGGSLALAYDAASQIASAHYAYDPLGRVTATPQHGFTWDGASRLTGIDGAALSYDGLGQVLTRTGGEAATRYEYNPAIGMAPVVAESDPDTGQALRYYVWTPDGRLLYMIDAADGNAVHFYHSDQVGSTLALTDADGEMTDAYAYDPYGILLRHDGDSPQPFTFAGARGVRREGAGGALYQMRARFYDAATGRFLSPEPLWPNLLEPRALNPYAYAGGDPVRRIDPTGLESMWDEFLAKRGEEISEAARRREHEEAKRAWQAEQERRNLEETARGEPTARPPRGLGSPGATEAEMREHLLILEQLIPCIQGQIVRLWALLPAMMNRRDLLLGERETSRKPEKLAREIRQVEMNIDISKQALKDWAVELERARAEQMALIRNLAGK